jgi:hypothetical protein
MRLPVARTIGSGRRGPEVPVERRLALLLCGTAESRRARADEAHALLRAADEDRLLAVMGDLNLFVLLGQRLRALGDGLGSRLQEAIERRTEESHARGSMHELLTLAVLDRLDRDGLRALGLKGTVLARELYGDVAWRSAGDIDILVAPSDLRRAIDTLEAMGWAWERSATGGHDLPALHETLSQPSVPRIELHWRIHWYEARFAVDALLRAARPAARGPLRMQPGDGLASLALFYARDGFTGLRLAADAAAWWDAFGGGADADQLIAEVAQAYPELAAALWTAAGVLGSMVGLPTRSAPAGLWPRLATPFYDVSLEQLHAQTSLVNVLLAPPQGRLQALRREVRKVPEGLERPLTVVDPASHHIARWRHVVRVAGRWSLALGAAVLGAVRHRGARRA